MIEKLNDKFVNAWVLRHELAAFAGDALETDNQDAKDRKKKPRLPMPTGAPLPPATPQLKAFAARAYEKYKYPVDSLLFDADGQFAAQFPASDLMNVLDGDAAYLQFLDKAAKK